jgi:hypothetical protein
MILTADHGMARDPAVTGADRYDVTELTASIEEAFGAGVVQQMRPTQIWLDTEVLRAESSSVEEVAAFLMAMPRAAVVRGDGEIERPDDPAFLAAIPTTLLGALPCAPDPGS